MSHCILFHAYMRSVVADNQLRAGAVISEFRVRAVIPFNRIAIGSLIEIDVERAVVGRVGRINQIFNPVSADD